MPRLSTKSMATQSGTEAAAAGGYCAILAMPNTEPAVDSAAVLGALVERAKDEAEIPVGFFAAISKGQDGAELTEMVDLAERGAAGFTDDGRPVGSPGLLRRALLLLSTGGDPGRGLDLHGRAVSAMADDLRTVDRQIALEDGVKELRLEAEGLAHVSEAIHGLVEAPDVAWRAYAAGVLAQELEED